MRKHLKHDRETQDRIRAKARRHENRGDTLRAAGSDMAGNSVGSGDNRRTRCLQPNRQRIGRGHSFMFAKCSFQGGRAELRSLMQAGGMMVQRVSTVAFEGV